jgi:RHS repeat-associated protein
MIGRIASHGWVALIKRAALIAVMLGASLAQAHDFGGPTDSGGDDPPDPGPPCNSCPCAGPPGGGDDGGGDGGGGGFGGGSGSGFGGGGGSGGPSDGGGWGWGHRSGNSTPNPLARDGKPVSLFNGAEEMTVTDLVVKGVMPILIQRKYDSRSSYDSPLGFGWAFLHDRRLYEYPDNSVVVRHGCGTRDRYVSSGGGYVTPVGSMLAKLAGQPDGSYRLNYLNGVVDTFDSQGRLVSSRDPSGNSHEYTYDVRGKLPLVGSSKESIAPTQPMTVAQNFRLTRIEERGANGALTGNYVTFEYDESTGRLASVTSSDGHSVTYQHDVSGSLTLGNLIQVNGLEGGVASYAYADPLDPHNLTGITSAVGRAPVVNTYDGQDRVITQEEGTRRMDITYPVPYGRTIVTKTIRDENGLNPYTAATTYEFDTTGRVVKLINALGHEARYTYNTAKLLARKEIWQKTGQTLMLLQAVDWSYDANGNKRTEFVVLDSGETVTRSWTYEQNWIASVQVGSSAEPAKVFRTEYTFYYGSNGAPINVQSEKRRMDNGTFQTTTYTYDDRNRLLTRTLPDGLQLVNEYTGDYLTRSYLKVSGSAIPQIERRFEYDAEGNRIKSWDARSNLTSYHYGADGRLLSQTNPLGEQAIYTYEEGKLTHLEVGRTVAAGEGQVTLLIYNTRDQVIRLQRKSDAGAIIDYRTYQYDSEGRLVAETDAENRTTTYGYDLVGRINAVTDPLGKLTKIAYDAAGNRLSVINPMNRELRYEYDDLGRMSAIVEVGRTTRLAYDAAGNVVQVTDPMGQSTSYSYDALSRKTRVIQPMGQVVNYVFDTRNRLQAVTDARGSRTEYDYEPWGALATERRYSSASSSSPVRTIAYGYDADGNLTSVTDDAVQAGAMWTLTYDALSRRYDETTSYLPGGPRVLRHRYDRFGNQSETVLDDGGSTTSSYSYNKLGRLTAATLAGSTFTIDHFANDAVQSVTLPNGVAEALTYRADGPIQTLTFNGPSGVLGELAYTYDDALNVDTLTDQSGVNDFSYDDLNRLTAAVRPAGSGLSNESYAYDANGNREDPTNANLFQYDQNNRITAGLGLTYSFDAAGNLATRSDNSVFTHDENNRLVQFQRGGTTAAYLHDAMGRRIRKTVNGVTTWFLWDKTRLIGEYAASGTRTKLYNYFPKEQAPRQIIEGGSVYYVHVDHLQTPRMITNSSAQVVWRAKYKAFGAAVVDADPDGNGVSMVLNLRFPGQYYDAESGLHYNYFRNYDPDSGRYIQADRIGLGGGLNLYAYALGNPLTFMDNLGLEPICVDNFKIDEGMTRSRETETYITAEYRWFEFDYTRTTVDAAKDIDAVGPGKRPPGAEPAFNFDFYWVLIQFVREEIYEVGKKWELWSQLCTETVRTDCGKLKTKVTTNRVRKDAGEAYRHLVETNYFTRRKRISNDEPPSFSLP